MRPLPVKKVISRAVLLVSIPASLYFVPWPLVLAKLTPLPSSVQELVESYPSYGFDGAIVYIQKKGESGQFYTSGYHEKTQKAAARADALFKIGSVTKLYDALILTKMVREGKLHLDSSLNYYLPALNIQHAEKITLRMLARHRSGIPNYTDLPGYWLHPKETDAEKIQLIHHQKPEFTPNSSYHYSNTNYVLLSKIMDQTLGYPHFAYLKKRVLDTLGLQNTYRSVDETPLHEVMSGYHVGYEQDLKTGDKGSMLATAEDLGQFLRALNEGRVFDDAKELSLYESLYEKEHTGLLPGYQTLAKYRDDTVIIQFTSTTNFEGYHWGLSEILYGKITQLLDQQENP